MCVDGTLAFRQPRIVGAILEIVDSLEKLSSARRSKKNEREEQAPMVSIILDDT